MYQVFSITEDCSAVEKLETIATLLLLLRSLKKGMKEESYTDLLRHRRHCPDHVMRASMQVVVTIMSLVMKC